MNRQATPALLRTVLLLAATATWLHADPLVYTVDPSKVDRTADVGIHGQFLEHIFNSVHGGLWGDLILNPSLEPNGGASQWIVTNDMVTVPHPVTNQPLKIGDEKWTDYEVTLEARRDEGSEGFLVLFRAARDRHYWINFGGWGNKEHGVEKKGGPLPHHRVPGTIEAGRWYKVRIVCNGAHFEISLDDQKVMEFEDKNAPLLKGAIGLNTWDTRASFRNIRVSAPDGKILFSGLPAREEMAEAPAYWSRTGDGKDGFLSMQTETPLNSATAIGLNVTRAGALFGIEQSPLSITRGETYRGSLYLRSEQASSAAVRILDHTGAVLFEKAFPSLPKDWQKMEFSFRGGQDEPDAAFQIMGKDAGRVEVDQINLFPQSALDAGGFRPDLLKAIADLKPASIRYPGGCFASGYHWKDGIGPREKRVYFPGVIWADRDPSQFGTDEFMELCRRVGAQPVIAINMTRGVDEALDWIEYCNGAANTRWGKVRADNGHPQPYGVKYWEVDNETWGMGPEKYADVVKKFAPAMKAKDPSILIAACGSYGYDDGKGSSDGWNNRLLAAAAANIDLLSIHYYNGICYGQDHVEDPRRFEAFIRDEIGPMIRASANPKMRVYCSEWGQMNIEWRSGLYAAGLLNGFERLGADLLPMSCPAVWLQLVGARGVQHPRWGSSHILFDQRQWFPAPTYVVQKLWREHFGPKILRVIGPNWPLNVVASSSADKQTIFFKVVNTESKPADLELKIAGEFAIGAASLQIIAPGDLKMRNWLDTPAVVAPVAGQAVLTAQGAQFTVPAQAVAALMLKQVEPERNPRVR
jgi:alpha-L-arabinofuranosidase